MHWSRLAVHGPAIAQSPCQLCCSESPLQAGGWGLSQNPCPAQLVEEVKFFPDTWLEPLALKMVLSRMQPEHGDIIIAQEELPEVRWPRAPLQI